MKLSLLCLLPALSGICYAAPEAPPDYRFKVEVLAQGMAQPMHLTRLDDGRIFFSEIAGKIKVLLPATGKVEDVGSIEVTTANENGLLGMALDPAFLQNGWIYLLHSPKDYPGQILSRYTITNNKMDPATGRDLLKWEEQRLECCHHAGTMRFGPDGCLFISTGDNTHPFGDSDSYAPLDERPGREPWDAQKSSGNTNDLRGKILRIRPTPEGSYTVPEGNLFKPGTPLTKPEIYAMGFRNPWRFNVDAATGYVYSGDVGPDAGGPSEQRGPRGYDTVNQVRHAGNYGWPYVRGTEAYHEFDFITKASGPLFDPMKPVNTSPNNKGARELPPVQDPLIWYPSGTTEKFPLLGSGGRTACAGPVFHFSEKFRETGGFPEFYDNCLIIYDWQRPFQNWARIGKDGKLAELLPFTSALRLAQGNPDGSGRFQIKRPVDMTFGSDGALYLLDYGETWGVNPDSQLIRISYQWGNLVPMAKVAAKNRAGREPLTVQLSSAGSSDRDGDALSYEWRLHPGEKVLGTTPELETVITAPGSYTIELRVNDGKGGLAMATVPVTVGNAPPAVSFDSPQEGDFFTPGKPVAWQVRVKDEEDGESTAHADAFSARTLVSTTWLKDGVTDIPPGLALMKHSDCFNCHAVEQKIVGPALLDVANKYRNQPGAEEVSVGRVQRGSANVWSPIPMLPHPQHSLDEIHQMVRYIYSLEPGKSGPGLTRALSGSSAAPDDPEISKAVLEASFTDAGRDAVPAIVGQASVTLRGRRIEAELAEAITGPGVKDFGSASAKKAVSGFRDRNHLTFPHIPLAQAAAITCRLASASTAGKIEFHAGSPDGELLTSLDFPATGAGNKWADFRAPLPPGKSTADVVLVFLCPPNAEGPVNLDWVKFEAP
jgi:cytochrome c